MKKKFKSQYIKYDKEYDVKKVFYNGFCRLVIFGLWFGWTELIIWVSNCQCLHVNHWFLMGIGLVVSFAIQLIWLFLLALLFTGPFGGALSSLIDRASGVHVGRSWPYRGWSRWYYTSGVEKIW